MRDDLLSLLEKADLAVASCQGVIDEETLAPLTLAVNAVRTRLAYPDEVLVVALAGGTGSGKSSLLNALAGEELVDVGGVRPTTSSPTAAVPTASQGSLDGYLDRLGIADRLVHQGSGLCLIDLPDMDSVELDHRHRVDAMLPLVDVVIWVTDPEKYRDARLHHDYLRPMAPYSDQFVFVMNQIDRLTAAQAEEVCHDLAVALEEDGISPVQVIPTAALPRRGPPMGIDWLRNALQAKRSGRAGLYAKLLTDLATTSEALEAEVGPVVNFDERAGIAVKAAAELLSAGDTPGAIAELTRFLDSMAEETGAAIGTKLQQLSADVVSHVDRVEAELAESKPPAERKGLFRRRQRGETATDADRAMALLSEAVVRPARAMLAPRALALASIAELAVEVEAQRSR
jgi:energy-coupling factor transporter ATP-binding protein EcfA2